MRFTMLALFLAAALSIQGCAGTETVMKPEVTTLRPVAKTSKAVEGTASYYGPGFDGKKTANGEIFDRRKLTAAHGTLPFGTMVRVTNRDNGASVVVRINDRYPGKKHVIDLSEGSFRKLAPIEKGIIPVRLEIVK